MHTPLPTNLYKHHRFPAEIISHGVWLYFGFCLSYRDVEELLLAHGIIVTYETIRQWCRKFGQPYANQLRRRRPRTGDKWHLDEVFLTIHGERHYLWRAVDQDGYVLDILVQRRRDKKAAKKFFRKLWKGLTYVPRVIITDQLKSYGAAKRGDPAQRRASAASLSEQPGGELPPTHPPAGAAYAGLQIARARPAVPLRLWSHRSTLPTETPSTFCPRVSPSHGPTIPELARSQGTAAA
jgi:transposase-like protein